MATTTTVTVFSKLEHLASKIDGDMIFLHSLIVYTIDQDIDW